MKENGIYRDSHWINFLSLHEALKCIKKNKKQPAETPSVQMDFELDLNVYIEKFSDHI